MESYEVLSCDYTSGAAESSCTKVTKPPSYVYQRLELPLKCETGCNQKTVINPPPVFSKR